MVNSKHRPYNLYSRTHVCSVVEYLYPLLQPVDEHTILWGLVLYVQLLQPIGQAEIFQPEPLHQRGTLQSYDLKLTVIVTQRERVTNGISDNC